MLTRSAGSTFTCGCVPCSCAWDHHPQTPLSPPTPPRHPTAFLPYRTKCGHTNRGTDPSRPIMRNTTICSVYTHPHTHTRTHTHAHHPHSNHFCLTSFVELNHKKKRQELCIAAQDLKRVGTSHGEGQWNASRFNQEKRQPLPFIPVHPTHARGRWEAIETKEGVRNATTPQTAGTGECGTLFVVSLPWLLCVSFSFFFLHNFFFRISFFAPANPKAKLLGGIRHKKMYEIGIPDDKHLQWAGYLSPHPEQTP